MKEIGIGLIGFGTVGAGVVECLQQNGALIARRTGMKLVLRKVADIDVKKDRGVKLGKGILTTDGMAVVADPSVQVVIELVGGTGFAKKVVLESIRRGKPVVTANKALLASCGAEVFGAAAKAGSDIFFEASVAGGVPIIRALTRGLVANRIEKIQGILNGTCNYILTRMTREGLPFDKVLAEAQAAGYAEADPGLDIDGHDTAHKAAILASLAYGCRIPLNAVSVEGIRGLAREDIQCALDLGYVIKLLAVIRLVQEEIEVRVHPALVPNDHMLASVSGVFNAILVSGDAVGDTMYYGRGAGRMPTASAVVSDLVDAGLSLVSGTSMASYPAGQLVKAGKVKQAGLLQARYYLRMSLLDAPGTLGRICTILGRHGISIASVLQKEQQAGKYVPVIMITHEAEERCFAAALREINRMKLVGKETIRLRIEDSR